MQPPDGWGISGSSDYGVSVPAEHQSEPAGPSRDGHPPHERTLAPSPFPGDDGAASAEVRAALATFAASHAPDDYLRAVATLCADRLLVPVVATATRLGTTTEGCRRTRRPRWRWS